MAAQWRIEMLGNLRASDGTRMLHQFRTGKTGLLLAYLAHSKRAQNRDALAALFWPDADPQKGRLSLRSSLAALKREMEGAAIQNAQAEASESNSSTDDSDALLFLADRVCLQLNPVRYMTDVQEFEAALREARRASSNEDKIEKLYAARELYRGAFLPGYAMPICEDEEMESGEMDWIAVERRRVEVAFGDALETLADLLEKQGNGRDALEITLNALAHDAYDERQQQRLLRAMTRDGQKRFPAAQAARLKAALASTEPLPPELLASLTRHLRAVHHSGHKATRDETQLFTAALETAYLTLTPDAQRFYARLSVFTGSFTAEQAQAIGDEPAAVSLLQQMAGQLVGVEPDSRYSLSEPAREFARRRLRADARGPLAKRHARYFLAQCEAANRRLESARNPPEADALRHDKINTLAALTWTLTETNDKAANDLETGLQMLYALTHFWAVWESPAIWRQWLNSALHYAPRLNVEQRCRLLFYAGEMAFFHADHAVAFARFMEWSTLARETSSGISEQSSAAAGMLNRLGNVAHQQERGADAIAAHKACLHLYRVNGFTGGQATVCADYADALLVQGQTQKAKALYDEALDLCRQHRLLAEMASVLHRAAQERKQAGDYPTARRYLNEGFLIQQEIHADVNRTHILADHLRGMGILHSDQGNYAEALALLTQSVETYRCLKHDTSRTAAQGSLGDAYLRLGQIQRALPYYEEGLAVWREQNHRRWQAVFLCRLALAAYYQARNEDANRYCEEAIELCPDSHGPPTFASALHLQARLLLRSGKVAQAEALCQRSLAVRQRCGYRRQVAESLELLAVLAVCQQEFQRSAQMLGCADALRAAMQAPIPPVDHVEHEQTIQAARSALRPPEWETAMREGRSVSESSDILLVFGRLS